MGILRSIAWGVVGVALKTVNPKRFKEITERGDKIYDLAIELVNSGALTPYKSKLFSSKDKAEAWVMKTHHETCDQYSSSERTIFPTVKNVGPDWVASVWVVEDEEVLNHFPEER